jgi:hypothetical protein
MKRIIRLKTDLAKIDGAKILKKDGRTFIEITHCNLFEGKGGSTYLDATLFLTDETSGDYGDHGMITQDLGKERREAGEKGPILGNAKILKIIDEGQPAQASLPPEPAMVSIGEGDDIPF